MRSVVLFLTIVIPFAPVVMTGADRVVTRSQILKDIAAQKKLVVDGVKLGKKGDFNALIENVLAYVKTHDPALYNRLGGNLTKIQDLLATLDSKKASPDEYDAVRAFCTEYANKARAHAEHLRKSFFKPKEQRYAAEMLAQTFDLYGERIGESVDKKIGK